MSISKDSLAIFLNENMGLKTVQLNENTELFSSALIDSFGVVDLITHIEKNAKIKFSPMDVNLENLDSISKIIRFVNLKKKESI